MMMLTVVGVQAATVDEVTQLVTDGHWRQAEQEISAGLADTNTGFETRQGLLFQRDRMARMRLDFSKTRNRVFREIKTYIPTLTDEQFDAWVKSGAIESIDIDGTRWYFGIASRNLFRVNHEAAELRLKYHHDSLHEDLYHDQDVEGVIATYDQTGKKYNSPHDIKVTYTLSVHPDAVPAGEILRAWLPYPHGGNRQHDIQILSTDPPRYLVADTNDALSCIYMEKRAVAGESTDFKVSFEYLSDAFYQPIDPAVVKPADPRDASLKPFMGEAPPEIVFSDRVKELSHQIVGNETNPAIIAKKLFAWCDHGIPWAPAREYSTIPSLPQYALGCGHGDCGIKTMTFMTLCRYNGIPAHWETGWTPGIIEDMHDWCEIYLDPYGWVPMDVTYGVTDCNDDRGRWFYFGGIDADRLVLNTNFCQPLFPEKNFFRSEIVDFQRGEVEWRGGNLYFNQWSYNFQVDQDLDLSTHSGAGKMVVVSLGVLFGIIFCFSVGSDLRKRWRPPEYCI